MLMLVTNVPIFLARFFSIIVICSASFFRARENTNNNVITTEVHLGPDGPLQNTCQKGFSNIEKTMERSDHWN